MTLLTATRPLGDVHQPIDTVEGLHEHLQWAFLVEFTTIPPYLAALYSIQDKTADAYQLIRSVALEEMLHVNLASNLLNGTGATPKLLGHVPEYPTYLTHHAAGRPYIQIMPASVALMTQTFMALELPAPFQAQRPSFVYLEPGPRRQVPWIGTDDDQNAPDYIAFADDIEMGNHWNELGFVFNVGTADEPDFVEVERTLPRDGSSSVGD